MLKTIFPCLLIFCASLCTLGQTGTLYKGFVFSRLVIQKNLRYAHNIPPGTKSKFYQFDFYSAEAEDSSRKPLIIWMHGGGFKFGSKSAKGIRLWSKSFAQRGYLCAAVNYRLSKKNPLRNFSMLVKSCHDALQDIEQAIIFFKENHVKYGIDTTRIILAGNSAGGMIALHSAYSSYAELNQLVKPLDSNLDRQSYNPNNIAAVINFWGALFNADWLRNTHVPIVSVHGKRDRVVPYERRNSPLKGSSIIHQKADSLHIPNRLKTYYGYGHELQKHFIPILRSGATKRRWLEAGKFAAEFLYDQLWK